MKKKKFQPSWSRFGISGAALMCVLAISSMYQLQAQTALQCDQGSQTISYNGSYQDFVVSGNAARITVTAKGGDGGKARVRYADCCLIDNVCNTDGGVGATVTATFAVGNGAGQIPPGSTIRFIVGGTGESGNNNNTFAGFQTGGGGGATGVLYKAPSSTSFTPLVIAGAGGGAYRGIALGICADNSPGRGGNYGANGDGGGGDIASGSGGTGGNGGGGNELAGGGGGGYLSDGDGVTCVGLTNSLGIETNQAGEGQRASDTGSPGGQSEGCTAIGSWKNGGFGYGSGGAGSEVGGGGGGYSGGGKGGTTGGGGGGGSYVNPMRLSESGSDGGQTGSPDNGNASYSCIPKPDNDNCASAFTLNCGGSLSGDATYATGDDKPAACTGSLNPGVWVKFTGTGDEMAISTAGSQYDTRISVYSGACTLLTCVESNDNANSSTSSSYLNLCTVKNQQYYIYLDAADNDPGNYSISLSCTNTPPQITCPNSITVDNDPDRCGAVVSYNVPVGTDNCPGVSTAQTDGTGLSSGDEFPVGTTWQAFMVTDAAGNTAFCSLNVVVEDAQRPEITCPSNFVVCSDPYSERAVVSSSHSASGNGIIPAVSIRAYAWDNCSLVSATYKAGNGPTTAAVLTGPFQQNDYSVYLPNGTGFGLGTTSVTYVVTDPAGNTQSCVFSVTVRRTPLPYFNANNIFICNGAGVNLASYVRDTRRSAKRIDYYEGDAQGNNLAFLGTNTASNGQVNFGQNRWVNPSGSNQTTASTYHYYYFSATNSFANGPSCEGPLAGPFVVEVRPVPSVSMVSVNPNPICTGTPYSVNFSASLPGCAFAWTSSNAAFGLPANGTGQIATTAPASPATTTLTAWATLNNCRSANSVTQLASQGCNLQRMISGAGFDGEAPVVFPNPFQNTLRIRLPLGEGESGALTLSISDLQGRTLKRAEWNSYGGAEESLELGGMASGMYFYTLNWKGAVFSGRLVRE